MMISEAPSTSLMSSLTSSALLAKMDKSSPKILIATSALTPVISSLKRISIGWVNSTSIPGMILSASLNLSANSSLLSALTHSSFGFSFMMTSLSSIDMGSVGTSAAPIRLTTWSTSGKFFKRIFSILVVISMVFPSDVPVFKTG